MSECPDCDGAGEVLPALARPGNPWVRMLPCLTCGGAGEVENDEQEEVET